MAGLLAPRPPGGLAQGHHGDTTPRSQSQRQHLWALARPHGLRAGPQNHGRRVAALVRARRTASAAVREAESCRVVTSSSLIPSNSQESTLSAIMFPYEWSPERSHRKPPLRKTKKRRPLWGRLRTSLPCRQHWTLSLVRAHLPQKRWFRPLRPNLFCYVRSARSSSLFP